MKLNHRDGGDDEETANKLISIYFAFFKLNAGGGGGGVGSVGKGKKKKGGEMDSKLVSALLTGVNRAYPYARLESGKVTEHVETMFKIIHTANFNTSLQVKYKKHIFRGISGQFLAHLVSHMPRVPYALIF